MSGGVRPDNKIKVDESLVAAVKQAMQTKAWKTLKGGRRRRSYSDSDAGGLQQNSPYYKGKKIPFGSDGKPLRCLKCQSEYHIGLINPTRLLR